MLTYVATGVNALYGSIILLLNSGADPDLSCTVYRPTKRTIPIIEFAHMEHPEMYNVIMDYFEGYPDIKPALDDDK